MTGSRPAKEYAWQGREFSHAIQAETDEGMRKKGTFLLPEYVQEFTVYSDEGPLLGGASSAPTPIGFFLQGAAFCTLTQLTRYAEMMKIAVDNAKVTVRARFRTDGSVLNETIMGSTTAFEVKIEIDSDDPPERIAALIRNAEAGCFVMQAIRNPTAVETAHALNGKALKIDA
jgi:uncharacterized OsmC-like protein